MLNKTESKEYLQILSSESLGLINKGRVKANIRTTIISSKIKEIFHDIKDGEYVLPDLQRNVVWKSKQRELFINSILFNYPIPPIMVLKGKNRSVILDGQQRLMTIVSFLNNKFKIPIGENKFFYKDLGEEHQYKINSYPLQIQSVEQIFQKDESDGSIAFEIFSRINTGGTSLTKMEVRYASFYCNYTEWLKKISSKILSKNNYKFINGGNEQETAEKILRSLLLNTLFKYKNNKIKLEVGFDEIISKKTIKLDLYIDELLNLFLKNNENKFEQYKKWTMNLLENMKLLVSEIGEQNLYSFNPVGKQTKKIQKNTLDIIAILCSEDLNDSEISNLKTLSARIKKRIENDSYDFYKYLFQSSTMSLAKINERIKFMISND